MEKPLVIARKEFIDNIVNLINANSDIPAFVIADVLKSCLTEVNILAEKQYQDAVKQYQEIIEKPENTDLL